MTDYPGQPSQRVGYRPQWHSNDVPHRTYPDIASTRTESMSNFLDEFPSPQDPKPRPQQCTTPDTLYDGTVPKGFATNGPDGLESVLLLLEGPEMVRSQCLQKCCELGPQQCQYLWLIRTKCFAVACSSFSTNCDPQALPANVPAYTSTYVKIQYNMDGSNPLHPVTVPPPTLWHEDNFPHAVISPSNVITRDSEIYLSAEHSSQGQQVNYATV